MPPTNQAQPGAMNLAHMHETGLNAIELICGAIARPVELFIRPWHGTRYFALPVIALSFVMMTIVPGVIAAIEALTSMIPFSHSSPSIGLLSLWSFSELSFAAALLHGFRLYKRMLHMQLEDHSTFEGPALPIFSLVPWCRSFWVTRIIAEPALLLIGSIVLQDLFLIQSSLAIYLQVAAVALALKSFTAWYRAWSYLRELIDARNAAPILARLAEDRASDDELASLNLASFPKDVAPDVRAQAAVSIARAYTNN